MPLPTTVTGTYSTGISTPGPFISSAGNVYVAICTSTNNLAMMKATDPTSSFSEVDSTHRPGSATNPAMQSPSTSYAIVQVGDILHIIYKETGAANLRYIQFDMSTDLWNTSVTAATNTTGSTGSFFGSLVRRSDGSFVAFYQSSTESIMGTTYKRTSYVVRSAAGVWGTPVTVSPTGVQNQHGPGTAVLGGSDRVHFFWVDSTTSSGYIGYHRSLSSTDVLDTAAAFDSTISTTTTLFSSGVSYVSGGNVEVRQPYQDSNGIPSFVKFVSGANPSFTTEAAADATELANGCHAVAIDGTDVYLLYSRSSDGDLYRDKNSGSGWGTDVKELDATNSSRVFATVYTRGSNVVLAYVVKDNTTVYYNEYVIRSVGGGSNPRRGGFMRFFAAA